MSESQVGEYVPGRSKTERNDELDRLGRAAGIAFGLNEWMGDFARNIGWAWRLIEDMRAHVGGAVWLAGQNGWGVSWHQLQVIYDSAGEYVTDVETYHGPYSGEHAPEAICRAYIAWKEGKRCHEGAAPSMSNTTVDVITVHVHLLRELASLKKLGDKEIAHSLADDALIIALRRLGVDVTEAYKAIQKWYA